MLATVQGRSPWFLAWERLRRNRVALAFGVLFVLLVLFCLAAPLWADHIAHTGPNQNHITDKIVIGGQQTYVVSPDGIPLGPGLRGRYPLGADQNGRDEMVRLLYGGRASLFIGIVAAIITTVLSVVFGLLSGFYGGFTDTVISRAMDVIWAFPVVLLGDRDRHRPRGRRPGIGSRYTLKSSSLWIPTLIIGFVYTPYMARPLRGEVFALREKEFIEAAVAQGGLVRIMFVELLPNLISTIIVFFTLNIANNMLTEAVLSYLAPESSRRAPPGGR